MSRIKIEDLPVEDAGNDIAAKIFGGWKMARRTTTAVPQIPLTYRWTQISGPTVVLSNPHSVVTTFVKVNLSGPRNYTFSLFSDG